MDRQDGFDSHIVGIAFDECAGSTPVVMPHGSYGKDTRLSSVVMVGSNPTWGTFAKVVER